MRVSALGIVGAWLGVTEWTHAESRAGVTAHGSVGGFGTITSFHDHEIFPGKRAQHGDSCQEELFGVAAHLFTVQSMCQIVDAATTGDERVTQEPGGRHPRSLSNNQCVAACAT